MRNGVLTCLGVERTKNIGDYMQSLAARQFAGRDAVLVERERIDRCSGGPTRLVMNLLSFGPDGRCQPPPEGKITPTTPPPPVRTEFRPYAERLARRCREFMEGRT